MTDVFVICPFHPVELNFLSRPILFESGWNWNLKIGFLGQYNQKTIFQAKWRKNTDELKIYLLWFSSTVWRGQFALKFCKKHLKRKHYKIFMLFSQVFSSSSFKWALLDLRGYLCCFRLCLLGFNWFLFYNKTRAFGRRNTDRN